VILLGPQVKYEAGRLSALAAPHGKAVAVIDMADYGMMRGRPCSIKRFRCLITDFSLLNLNHHAQSCRLRAALCMPKGASMQTLKIAVIGGGSSYTPELIEGIIVRYEQLPVTELALVDVESGREKVGIIAALTQRMLKHKGLEHVTVSVHFTLDEAIRGASFV
jgi:hypothetical protein